MAAAVGSANGSALWWRLIRKEVCSSLSVKEAFQYAIHDLSAHYRAYYEFYVSQ